MTDLAFSEDPKSQAKDQQYRIFGEKLVRAHCIGGKAKLWADGAKALKVDSGWEPKPPIKVPTPRAVKDSVSVNGKHVHIEFGVAGGPHQSANVALWAIRKRSCQDIWFRLKARLSCVPGQRGMKVDYVTLDRSQFPSVRVWYNGKVFKPLSGTGVAAGTGTGVQSGGTALWNWIPNSTRLR